MTIPSWTTESGLLDTITENLLYEYQLLATGSNVKFKLQAGSMPAGLKVNEDGLIKGTPYMVNQTTTSTFVIRAYDSLNEEDLYDRTFSITVVGANYPFFVTTDYIIVNEYSGVPIEFKVEFADPDTTQTLTLTLIEGTLPPGLNIDAQGNITGIVSLLPNYSGVLAEPYDQSPYDVRGYDLDAIDPGYNYKDFPFTLRVSDGTLYDTETFCIRVKEPPIDLEPVILDPVGSIGTYRHNNYFEFRFRGYDVFNQTINWTLVQPSSINYDPLYDENFPNGHNPANDGQPGSYDVGFYDSTAYDVLPFTLDIDSGVLYGMIPSLVEEQRTYSFLVRATKPVNGVYAQKAFNVTFIGENDKDLTWISPSTLGSLAEGDLSHYQIVTTNPSNLPITYEYVTGNLPEGLTILPSGAISGRVKFGGFSLDAWQTEISDSTFDQTNTFTVRGYSADNYISSTETTTTYVRKFFTGDGVQTKFDLGVPVIAEGLLVYLNGVGQTLQNLKARQSVEYVTISDAGSGYSAGTTVTFSNPELPGGYPATGYVSLIGSTIGDVVITSKGSGYLNPPMITITDSDVGPETPAVCTAVMGVDVLGSCKLVVDAVQFFDVPLPGDEIVVSIPYTTTTETRTYLIDETKEFTINILNPYVDDYANVYIEALPKKSQRDEWYALLNNNLIFPTSSLYYPDDESYNLPKKPKFLFLAGLTAAYAHEFLAAMNHNFYKKQVIVGNPAYTTAYDPVTKLPIYEAVYLPVIDDLENNKNITVSRQIDITGLNVKKFTSDTTFYTVDETVIDASWIYFNNAWPNSYANMQDNIIEEFSYVTSTSFSGFPLWMKPLYPNLLNSSNPREVYKRAIPLAFVKVGEAKRILSNIKFKKIDFKRFTFEINRLIVDENLGTTLDENTTTINQTMHTEFDNHKLILSTSMEDYDSAYVLDPNSELRSSLTQFDGQGTRFIDEGVTFDRNENHQLYLRFNNNNVLE